MSPIVVLGLAVTAGAVFVLVQTLTGSPGSSGLLGRLDEPQAPMPGSAPGSPLAPKRPPAEAIRATLQQSFGRRLERSDRGSKLAQRLLLADLKLKPFEWVLTSAGVAALAGFALMVRFGSPIFLAIGAVLGWFGAQFFVRYRMGKRRKAFDNQLAPTILALSSAMKAGYTFAQALDLVARNSAMPMGGELSRVTRETQLGVPIIEALAKMVSRNDSEDLRLMLTAVQIQSQVGGNLAQILDSIEGTVRERVRIKGEIKTLTGQARASGWILIILPFALGGILSMIAPSYFTPMFKELPGQIMLGLAGFALLCGYGIIRKIVNIKV